MAEATAPTPAPSSTGVRKLILLAIVLVLGYGIYKSAGNSVPKTPDDVLVRMTRAMATVKTAEFAGNVSAKVEGAKNPLASIPGATTGDANKPFSFALAFSGTSAFDNWEKPQSKLKATLTSSELTSAAEIELTTVGEDKYFKLNTLPMLGKLDLSALTNMWVRMQSKPGAVSVTVSSTMSPETTEAVKNIISGGKYFQVTEDVGEEDLSGITTHHYKIGLNEAEVMRVIRAVSEKMNGKSPSIDDEKKMKSFFDRSEFTNGEVWVGTKDYYLYKLSGGVTIAPSETEKSSGSFTFALDLRNFNKPVTVDAPAGAKSMSEFMGGFISAMMGGVKLPAGMMGTSLPTSLPSSMMGR